MSTEADKFKNSKRRLRDEAAIAKQLRIAREQNHMRVEDCPDLRQPHRYAKHHIMDCGNPGCMVCGNPRKTYKEITTQEKRLFQDIDTPRNTHSNGMISDQSDKNNQ